MATISFNNIDDLLNGKRAQDTLAQGAQGVQSNPELPGYSGKSGGDTAGFAGGGGAGEKFQSGPKAKDPMAIIEANKGAQALNLAQETTGKVQEATKGLQNQADAYVSKMGATPTKGIGQNVWDDLFSGGAKAGDAAAQVRSRLDQGFKADDLNLDNKEAWDAQAFSDPTKLKALRRETGNQKFQGGYTSGMQALDEAVERRTPVGNSGVLNATQNFRQESDRAANRGQTAKTAAEERWNRETQGIRSNLTSQAGKVEADLASKLQKQTAEDARTAAKLRADAIAQQKKDAGLDTLSSRVGEFKKLSTPTTEDYAGKMSPLEAELAALAKDIDAGKYVQTSAPNRTREDVASAEDRVSFNLINELLGTGQRLGQGVTAAPTVRTQDVRSPADKVRAELDSLFASRAASAKAFQDAVERNKVNAAAAQASPNTVDPNAPRSTNIQAPIPSQPVEPGQAPQGPIERGPLTGTPPTNPTTTKLNNRDNDPNYVSPVAKPVVKLGDWIAKKTGWW